MKKYPKYGESGRLGLKTAICFIFHQYIGLWIFQGNEDEPEYQCKRCWQWWNGFEVSTLGIEHNEAP